MGVFILVTYLFTLEWSVITNLMVGSLAARSTADPIKRNKFASRLLLVEDGYSTMRQSRRRG